ncbi:helix-turn-helix domain-containing protein [Acinetobacter soli]|uniref:helix-turn-helix domain-containing protein n=1 Tax=Acinetobacter soli TaxID=487316 RepID=UPI001F3B38B8|nr:helix-turn-helix domain-containing protein [Acinetobacter soli]MCE6007569.1 helix-turn-helix domain-containing protein [Acinetobacter soli]MDN8449651.1 helix-turn-helix domain-containing protein [Acinetobacter baumannii]
MYHYTESGLRNVWLENGYIEKETPYGKAVSFIDLDGLHRAIGLHLVNHKPRLTGAEVRYLRKEMNLSQEGLADILGVSDSSVRAWENHRTKIPKPSERLLRVMYKGSVDKESDIRIMLDKIAHLDRQMYENKANFSHKQKGGWTENIAA